MLALRIILQPKHVLHIKRIYNLFAVGRDHGVGDIDVGGSHGAGQIIKQARAVAGVDLDDGVDLGSFVVEGDMGRYLERLFALLDLVARFERVARDNFTAQGLGDHLAQAGQAGGFVGVAVGILYPEGVRHKAVLGGITARVHHIGPHQCQRTRKS